MYRVLARDRLDATKVGTDRGLADDLDQADVTCGAHMRATTQLDRMTDLENPDDLAVLVTEERDGTQRAGLVLRRLERPRRGVGQRLIVGDPLDLGDLSGGHCVVVAEIEPQPLRSDERPGLFHMLTEHLAQRIVQNVRAGVVATDRSTPGDVDRGCHRRSCRKVAVDDSSRVPPEAR